MEQSKANDTSNLSRISCYNTKYFVIIYNLSELIPGLQKTAEIKKPNKEHTKKKLLVHYNKGLLVRA